MVHVVYYQHGCEREGEGSYIFDIAIFGDGPEQVVVSFKGRDDKHKILPSSRPRAKAVYEYNGI